MDIRVVTGDVTRFETPALIVNLFEGVVTPGGATGAVDRALDGALRALIADGELTGKRGERVLIHTFGKLPAKRVLVLGLGKRERFDADAIRRLVGEAVRFLRDRGVGSAATIAHGAGIGGMDPRAAAEAIATGAVLGAYRFDRYQAHDEDGRKRIDELTIVEADAGKAPELEAGVSNGRVMAEAVSLARDLVNEPANVLTPARMAGVAKEIAERHGMACTVLEEEEMRQMGMGALLAAGRGSSERPRLIALRYTGRTEDPTVHLGLVGKGVCFDSGGISLKTSAGMEQMKGDMAGGAAVLCAMQAIAVLKPRVNVLGVVPAVENMPSGTAQKVGDVVRAMSGKHIEVLNTDAEGRLILADALTYARQQGAQRLVDVATLTGAIVTTLGHAGAGLMTTNRELADAVRVAADQAGEKVWELPLWDEFRELIKSNVADIKNTGGRDAGSITAALFLREFVGDTPWVHLDIAGTFMSGKDTGHVTRGATGTAVQTLARLAQGLAG